MSRKLKRYTHDEAVVVVQMWQRGAPISVIAKKVGRTTKAVAVFVNNLRKKGVHLTKRTRRTNGVINYTALKRIAKASLIQAPASLDTEKGG